MTDQNVWEKKKRKKKWLGVELVCSTMLSEIFGSFGDFEDFVNVIGKDCGEVGS